MEAGKTEWGVSRREGERETEEQIKGVRDGAKERLINGVGWEMTIGKDARVFQINRTNKMSIKVDINILGSFSFTGLLCHDFRSS